MPAGAVPPVRWRKSIRDTRRLQRALAIGVAAVAIFGSIGNARQVIRCARSRWSCPIPPAGLFDSLARVLAEAMRGFLSQSVVIENVGGASGSIAAGHLARAAPDGYTIGIGSRRSVRDQWRDLRAPIRRGEGLRTGRAADERSPSHRRQERTPGQSEGADPLAEGQSADRCVRSQWRRWRAGAAGASWPFIPYRGAAPALQDMIGGRVDVMCPSPASSLAMAREGLIRAYAVTGSTRLTSAPDIPTVDEAGLAELHISVWGGVFAPKGTPKSVIARLNAALVGALADPGVRQKFVELGQEIFPRAGRPPRRSPRFRKPRSRSGGRSSRPRHQRRVRAHGFSRCSTEPRDDKMPVTTIVPGKTYAHRHGLLRAAGGAVAVRLPDGYSGCLNKELIFKIRSDDRRISCFLASTTRRGRSRVVGSASHFRSRTKRWFRSGRRGRRTGAPPSLRRRCRCRLQGREARHERERHIMLDCRQPRAR